MAIDWEILKSRYVNADEATQIESLLLNLLRLRVLVSSGVEESTAQHLIKESQLFIEWIVPSIDLDTRVDLATDLVDLQRSLSKWKLNWPELWHSELDKQALLQDAEKWCNLLQNREEKIAS